MLDGRGAAAPARALRRSSTTRTPCRAIVDGLLDRVEIHTLDREDGPAELGLNDIGRVRLRTARPVAFDPYARNRATGSFILIDEATNETVGAGMIVPTPASA